MEMDKVDDITDPNTGEVIVEEDAAQVTIPEAIVEAIPTRKKTGGKVGRPITSPRTMAANKKKRFSSIKKSLVRSTWQEKMKLKAERKAIKEQDDKFKARRQQKLEETRRRRQEARKLKEENQRKAEVVEPIKNTSKIRRMTKKQLKRIRKA